VRRSRPLRLAVALAVPLLSLTATTLVAPTWAAGVDTTVIRPGELPRGENPQVPYLVDGRIVHGDVRVDVPQNARLVGAAGEDYLILVPVDDTNRDSLLLVRPDGSTEQLLTARSDSEFVVSEDGTQVVRSRIRRVEGKFSTPVRVHDSHTGDRLVSRTFNGGLDVLAAGDRIVLGGWSPKQRTLWWNATTDATSRILDQVGYLADIGADRLVTYTDDPYDGGCSVLRSLSKPREVLTRSCSERVTAVSPSGRRVATIHILADGLGPREVNVRGDHGRLRARYQVAGWFGQVEFETNRALLLESTGRQKQALVRCDGADCERASRLRPAPQL
jgi:hypothetical protein